MKKVALIFIALLLTTVGSYYTADYYRADLYKSAIEFETTNANLHRRSAKINTSTFHYLESSKTDGETIVLLHGFSANKDNWLRYAKPLSKNLHVIALDLLGHGENKQDLNQKYSLSDQVEFVRKAVEEIGVDKFHVAGNSMGGAISVLYAATYPDQILSATLISPAGIHDIPSTMDAILEKGGNPLIAKSVDEFSEVLEFVMEDGPYMPDALIKHQGEVAAARVDINKKIFSDFINSDLANGAEEKMAKIKAPVLFIWGDHDRAINVKNIDKYASLIPNSQKLILKNIGHLAMVEVPDVSANATLEFIKKTRKQKTK